MLEKRRRDVELRQTLVDDSTVCGRGPFAVLSGSPLLSEVPFDLLSDNVWYVGGVSVVDAGSSMSTSTILLLELDREGVEDRRKGFASISWSSCVLASVRSSL